MTHHVNMPAWLDTVSELRGFEKAPAWLAAQQQGAWKLFLEQGVPTRKMERWKYADLSFLAKKQYVQPVRTQADGLQDKVNQHRLRHGETILMLFVNGYFMTPFSDWAKLPEGVIACGMNEALEKYPELVEKYWLETSETVNAYPFANLNAANSRDGLFLYVPDKCDITLPIHLLSIVDDNREFISHPRHLIILGKRSCVTLIEEYFAFGCQAYMINTVLNILVDNSAKLTHYKLQEEGRKAVHLAHTFVQLKQDSSVDYVTISTGSQFARDELLVNLKETGTEFRAAGFYQLGDDNQYIDHHIDINHLAPRSNSEMLYKGILDKKSRAVFNGRLYVEKDAQKILAYQANHNLLLSNNAEVYSKPELEIYADDVKCKHGASTGQLDQDALFYLCSRGIAREEALAMLLHGFADEIIDRVVFPALRERVMEMLL